MMRPLILWFMIATAAWAGPVQQMQQMAVLQAKRAGGGGGPLEVTDTFDGHTNDATLESHANWTATLSSWLVTNPTGTAGAVRPDNAGDESCIHYSGSAFNANHSSEIVILDGAAGGVVGPAVRCQAGAATYYGCYWEKATSRIYLFRSVAGTWTEITRYTSQTLATGNLLYISANGTGAATRLTVQKDVGAGWVALGTAVDPGGTYIDGGAPGVTGYDSGNDTSVHITTWTGRDL